MPKDHRSLKLSPQKTKKLISIKFAVLIAFSCLLITFVAYADESFLNEPPFDSPSIESSNPITSSILTITSITQNSVTLFWTKNPDPDFFFYDLYRIISLVPLNVIRIARIYDRNQTSFIDALPQGTTYYYQIRTYNQAGEFVRSNFLGALYVSYANITVDGSVSDWSGLNVSIQDYINDKQPGSPLGTDISNIYLAHDNRYFYIRMDLADGSPNTQDVVYYHLSLNKQRGEPAIGDRYILSYFFSGSGQNQSILQERTSIDPHQAFTVARDIAAAGTNTLEMRMSLDKLNGGLLYFYAYAATSAGPPPIVSYDGTVQIVMKIPILSDKAVELAKEVLGAPYLGDGETWGGKGHDCKINKFTTSTPITTTGYYYFDKRYEGTIQECQTGKGLDCSGLSFWSYNRAFYGDKTIAMKECSANYTISPKCPLAWENADGQYKGNVKEITKEELKPGDLLFFNSSGDKNKLIKHVAMYVGNNEVVEASLSQGKIIKDTLDGILVRFSGMLVGFGRVIEPKIGAIIEGKSSGHSIDLNVTDPDGIILNKEIYEVPGMYYREYDIDDDGRLEDVISMPERKIGDYLIQVAPEPDALPTDTYTLKIEALVNGVMIPVVLAENVPISDIPRIPYIIKSTEIEIIPIIPAFVDFNPDTLNLKSKGQDVTVYIELPKSYDIKQINLGSIRLNNQIPIEPKPTAIGDYDKNGIPDLMVKFNRSSVQNILTFGGKVKITVSGKLNDGRLLEGYDTIKVISTGKSASILLMTLSVCAGTIIFVKQRRKRNSLKNKNN